MASQIASYLPQAEGLLPKWLLFVSVTAAGNSIQAYLTQSFTERVYNGTSPSPKTSSDSKPAVASTSPVNALSARTFGTWTFLSAVVRFYAAYHIHEPAMYELAYWTYVIALVHFGTEWFVFKTARLGPGIMAPAIVASVSLVWMGLQWGYYVN